MTTFAELLDAIGSETPFTQPATVTCTAAEFEGLTSPQIAGLDALNVAVIDITQGTLTLSVGQAIALAESDVLLSENDTAVVAGAGIGDLTPDNISALADKGFVSFDASEPVTFDADQAFALSQASIAFAAGDEVTVELSSDDVGEWAGEIFTRLADRGIDTIDVISQGGSLALTVEQALAFAASSIELAQDDAIVVTDSGDNLAGLSTADYTAFHLRGITLLDSTSDEVELTVAQAILLADSELGYVAEDTVTIVVGSTEGLGDLTPARIEDLGNKGVNHIASDTNVTLTAAQAAKLAGTAVTFVGAGLVTVQDTGSKIAALSPTQIGALIDAGIDGFDASGSAITLTITQLDYLSGRLDNTDGITLADEALLIERLDAVLIESFAALGIVAVDATNDELTLSLAQYDALGDVALTAGDEVTVSFEQADVAALTAEALAAMSAKGVDSIKATGAVVLTVEEADVFLAADVALASGDGLAIAFEGEFPYSPEDIAALSTKGFSGFDATDAVVLSFEQASALAGSNLSFASNNTVTVNLTGAELIDLSGTELAALAARGVDGFVVTGNVTFTAAQAAALAGLELDFEADAVVSVVDEGANFAVLSAEAIQALITKGVTLFDASDDEIALTIAQLNAIEGHLAENDAVTLADTGETIAGMDVTAIGGLAARGVVTINVTGNGALTLSFAKFSALGTIALTTSDTVTVTVSAADLEDLDLGDVANQHVDVLDASDPVTLTADQAFDLVSSPLIFATSNTVSVMVAEGNIPFDADDFATLKAKGVDVIDVEGANGALAFTVSQALGFADSGITLAAGDTVKVVDNGAALAGLTESQFNALLAKGFTLFDADNDAISLTVAKLAMFNDHLATDDQITLADHGSAIASLSLAELAGLPDLGVVAINADDNQLTLSVEQFAALPASVALAADDEVVVSGMAANFVNLDEEALQSFADFGVDRFHATDAVTLSVAQAIVLAGSRMGYTAGSSVKIEGTSAAFNDLTAAQIRELGNKGADVIDLSDGNLSLSVEKAAALAASGIVIADGDNVGLQDSGRNISALTNAQIAALATQGLRSIDASDDVLSLTPAQLNALGTIALTPADMVTLADTGAALARLSSAQIAEIAAKGIDAIDASDNALALSVAQYNALGSVALTSADTITLSDTGAALGAFSVSQIAALAGKGVDALDASTNALSLSLAQFNALGTVALTATDVVTLADTGASLVGLSAAQMSALGTKGVDVYDLTDNAVTLTAAQLASLGSIDLASGDRVTVNGTAGADAITGKSSNDVIKGLAKNDVLAGGNGNDQLWGGTGKDVVTGGSGQDVFVFDAALTRANVDQITDFSVADDTIWLDNKYLKKIGKGSVTKPGKVNKNFFKVADKAKDGNDYLVYNKKTGVLYYDEDGSGAKAAVQIAKLAKNLKLTANDFFVI